MVEKRAANNITLNVRAASINKPPIILWLGIELVFLTLVVAGAWFLQTLVLPAQAYIAVSCLLGGLVAIIPHAYFAGLAWRYTGARAAPWMVKAFYRGESGKFILTLVGFGLIFTSPLPVQAVAVFVSYVLLLALQIGLAAKCTGAQ
ncbi:ATP synthase subunit I [Simiduia curdlanivorans]|nr:ATP synthase subunit I [Simiduia curdlanivorans]MDN3637991.1 ATP synthase subunit I [Simiduia curdlanivorans]